MTIRTLEALNDPSHEAFDPTVFVSWDTRDLKLPVIISRFLLQPYIKYAQNIVRVQTDVVMLTHLILYFTTSLPSALFLYYHFSWTHGLFHWLMQSYYVGTYTLMMHQYIHMHGILSKKYQWFDELFPYITNPLMGHTWNSYYYHHVKHHHVEGNGPDDLSSTIRYQRDDFFDFLRYIGRFFFLIWLDLPLYFFRKNKPLLALRAAGWELANYLVLYILAAYVNTRATIFVFILPLLLLRLGLMVGNWGQHAFVDKTDPDSDFRSSITLIDVAVSDNTSRWILKIWLIRFGTE
jgi:phosphoinositide-3-kinase regulatory subunit 4